MPTARSTRLRGRGAASTSTPARLRARAVSASALAATALVALTGCGLQSAAAYAPDAAPGSIEKIDDLPADAKLTITSKNFTEQLVLGKIAVIATKAAGFDVVDKTNVPGSVPVRQLMLSHDADMTWEYTGTAWLTFLGHEQGIPDKQEQYQAVKDADARSGLSWLPPAPMNNTYALAVRSEAAEELGVSKLSDIAKLPVDERTICVESEFNSRSDGLTPMLKKYGLERGSADGVPNSNIKIYDTGAVYTATDKGTACNFGEVFTTDGRIKSLDLTVLEDDLGFFPAYNVAPVVSTDTLKRYPGLADVFEQISPKLTDETLQELNLRVDEGGEDPGDVAFDFLEKNGFVTKP
ncbi:glycine betaine ABC transporter substrate-binding protein [Schumannella sp. 10F1B-5-1]|uniref:glycine betaine ABC transporter substrate-binding protein n=1 Tax=Schumannella sp. 10F1B-5-1 TaxID=2590780 RepID=UPI00113297B1|nr:glycine betaine ABC transporter substrate-binding protein [Schumannella sp. 10F1B-5-1]TPW72354.1 glycine betaine ABC transporter substrate-binding protein [Schumannella sp. 10F1B-5-1]